METILFGKLKSQGQSFDWFKHALDDSNITDTEQLIIFTCGTDTAFHGYERHADLCSLIGTTTGNEIVLKTKDLILWYWAQKN
jgi:hypothetical protein